MEIKMSSVIKKFGASPRSEFCKQTLRALFFRHRFKGRWRTRRRQRSARKGSQVLGVVVFLGDFIRVNKNLIRPGKKILYKRGIYDTA